MEQCGSDLAIVVVIVAYRLAGGWVEDHLAVVVLVVVEGKHAVERASDRVCGAIADSAKVPVVFNEAEYGRLISHAMVGVIVFRVGRDD